MSIRGVAGARLNAVLIKTRGGDRGSLGLNAVMQPSKIMKIWLAICLKGQRQALDSWAKQRLDAVARSHHRVAILDMCQFAPDQFANLAWQLLQSARRPVHCLYKQVKTAGIKGFAGVTKFI
jgi:hypothetical protein